MRCLNCRTPFATCTVALTLAVRSAGADEPEAAAPAASPQAAELAPAKRTAGTRGAGEAPGSESRLRYQESDELHGHHGFWGTSRYRSPGLAFALSLTPLPVDFGNFYAENLPWGIAYTGAELALGTSIVWVAGGPMMCGHGDCDGWSDGKRVATIALVSGYVATKFVAGIHASIAAQRYNERNEAVSLPFVVPQKNGVLAGWRINF